MDDNKKEQKDIEEKSKQKKDINKMSKEELDEEIEKAKKEMEELMKSLQDQMGQENVKVVKIQIPRPTIKHYIYSLLISLVVNTLLFIGCSGFINFLVWDSILDLVLFSAYFSVIERTVDFIFLKYFTPLIIRSMGIAAVLPFIISILFVLIFPIFVVIEEVVLAIITLAFICVCKSFINSFIQNKLFIKKPRRKK